MLFYIYFFDLPSFELFVLWIKILFSSLPLFVSLLFTSFRFLLPLAVLSAMSVCVCAVCAVSVCLCRLYACTPSVPYKTHSFIFFFASSLPSSSWFCYLYGGKTMLSKSVWHTVCVCVYAVLACVIWVLWCTRLLCIHTDPYRNDRYRKPRESTARYRQMNSSKSIRHDDERR